MNIKRSNFKWLMASAAVGLFLANCTVKESKDESCDKGDVTNGCTCPGGLKGHQECGSDGVFGSCICPDDNSGAGTNNSSSAGKSNGGNSSSGGNNSSDGGEPPTNNGGKASTAGTDAGGVAAVNGGAGGEGGSGPVVFPTYDTCEDCLLDLCQDEMNACLADEACFSAEADGTGEYEAISECIETARASGLVKRDALRNCGVTFGGSSVPDPDRPVWAPPTMAATTTNLLNCLATSSSQTPDAQWANDPNNYPASGPTPWPEDSCAKLACTSAK